MMSHREYPADDDLPESGIPRAIILDTPKQLEMFHLLQLKYALRIEIDTGLRHSRGSVLKVVNAVLARNTGAYPHRTKKAGLKALEEYIEKKEGEFHASVDQ